MSLTFIPHQDDTEKGTLADRIEVLMEAADRYKAEMLGAAAKAEPAPLGGKLLIPRDLVFAYNWEEIARVLREIRELPEATTTEKIRKADLLSKLAEVYEVLRAAKMSKLEAVRLALKSEASQLRSGASPEGT